MQVHALRAWVLLGRSQYAGNCTRDKSLLSIIFNFSIFQRNESRSIGRPDTATPTGACRLVSAHLLSLSFSLSTVNRFRFSPCLTTTTGFDCFQSALTMDRFFAKAMSSSLNG
ncbi:hypothetical protein Ppro_2121 [Pelobacter propionicus DSM 2379]|uniref:Uncharacterized protein n=1 Tax=Pelobacter propionicus (strain DSM 2379 / NBRC 103807 / OttBd1) TaxID=338966 RepID=A1AQV9_PELPD|nr:hypothetical protein Ppro_2121 [Pelobacter propionicus DSM 2379]